METLKDRLQEKTEKHVLAEDALLETRQQFEANLSELKSKAELLSSALDKEAATRQTAQEEVCVGGGRGDGDGDGDVAINMLIEHLLYGSVWIQKG